MEITRNPNVERVAVITAVQEGDSSRAYDITGIHSSSLAAGGSASFWALYFALYNIPVYVSVFYGGQPYHMGDDSMGFQIPMEFVVHIANEAGVDFDATNPGVTSRSVVYQPFATPDETGLLQVTAPAVDATGLIYDKQRRIFV